MSGEGEKVCTAGHTYPTTKRSCPVCATIRQRRARARRVEGREAAAPKHWLSVTDELLDAIRDLLEHGAPMVAAFDTTQCYYCGVHFYELLETLGGHRRGCAWTLLRQAWQAYEGNHDRMGTNQSGKEPASQA